VSAAWTRRIINLEGVPMAGQIPAAKELPRGARVLVVDDEPLVGRAVARVLRPRHEVVVATTGRDALAHIKAGEKFDLVLCDLMMPSMSGMEVYRAVEDCAPELVERFVFLTGGAFTLEAEAFLAATRVRQIIKPFDSAALRLLAAASSCRL
jgi:CheY-like chemotaxis protein